MTDEKENKFSSIFLIDKNLNATSKNEFKASFDNEKTIIEEEYNPFEHRNLRHPNTFFGALVHLMRSSLGTGILAMPNAVKSVGIVVGVVGTILVGILCTHTIHILIFASQTMCKRAKVPMLNFSDTVYEVFRHGPKKVQNWAIFARRFVDASLLITGAGTAVYVVFVCENVKDLITYHYPSTIDWPMQYYMLAILPPLIICCQIRQLKHLVPFSLIANSTTFVAFGITLYYLFSGIGSTTVENRKLFNDIRGFPLYFSTVIFAMEGIYTMLPIENTMAKPQFIGCPGVLNFAMGLVMCLYTIFGFFGYIRFGDGVGANIIGNLPNEEMLAQVAKSCIAISVFFTLMLQLYVPSNIIWSKISSKIPEKRHNIAQIVLRVLLVMIVVAIAAAVPRLDTIISLVGSVCLSTLGLFIPVVTDTIFNMGDKGDFGILKWRLWKNIFIAFLSWFALFSGSYYSILGFINSEQ